MSDGKWYKQEDFVITGYTDHQKMIQEMRSSGYQIESRRAGDHQEYRLLSVEPKGRPKKSRVPAGKLKSSLFARDSHTCAFCRLRFDESALAPDHRIPVNRGGTVDLNNDNWMDYFQTTCVSDNHAKREACKRCDNQDPEICSTCFWHDPNHFSHIATKPMLADVVFWPNGSLRTAAYVRAKKLGLGMSDYLVQIAEKDSTFEGKG